jgi:hypothetical protein
MGYSLSKLSKNVRLVRKLIRVTVRKWKCALWLNYHLRCAQMPD